MELHDLEDYLADEFEFPVDAAHVIERVGDVELEAPDSEDSVTIDSLLDPLGEDHYESPTMLKQTLSGQLPDEFVGRKHYDDRGPNVEGEDSPRDDDEQAF